LFDLVTVFFTPLWDVVPGESSNSPTKWMSGAGKIMYMVSFGENHFCLRRMELKIAMPRC
jgi:hypothetical protein